MPGRRALYDADIRRLIEGGASVAVIADRIGKSPRYVRRRLLRLGREVAKPTPKPAPKVTLPPPRPPRVIVRKAVPPRAERQELSKPELLRMLAAAVRNTR